MYGVVVNDSQSKYLNRELSWLEFNQRVLDEARDPGVPLLERLKFLAITATNLDEFFMVRVGGLQMLAEQGNQRPDPAGLTPSQQLSAISHRVHRMVAEQYDILSQELQPQLAEAGIRQVRPGELSPRQHRVAEQIFADEISAILTPMGVFADGDFPLLANQALVVCARLAAPPEDANNPPFALIPLGKSISRFITLPTEGRYEYMLLEDLVAMFIDRFFPGESVQECALVRVTRNADLSIREDQAADLLSEMEEVLDARRRSDCVRLELAAHASPRMRAFLQQRLEVGHEDTYLIPGPLDLAAYLRLTERPGLEELKYEPWPPRPSPDVDPRESMFDTIARRDVLLYHPYESFEPVMRFVEEAAADPDVLAIKQILYRTSHNSPIVASLIRAAENRKSVAAVVELKARFDEARNIEWARSLEEAGVQVIYGVRGLKTHAKLCLVVRREPHGIQRYAHFSTGNYNEQTSRIYSDACLFTCSDELTADASAFFNAITGYSQPERFHKLEAAPLNLRERLLEMIEVEARRKRHGKKAQIMVKLNSLVDPAIIDALYQASQAGVRIQLNVRGICCLRPGVPGLSETIQVISIVDRFLEHARIFYFYHGGDERVFLSSADWMPRNLDRRVELMVPIEDPRCRDRLMAILETYFDDTVKARSLLPDGTYQRVAPPGRRRPLRAQEALYRQVCEAVLAAQHAQPTIFDPHRAAGAES